MSKSEYCGISSSGSPMDAGRGEAGRGVVDRGGEDCLGGEVCRCCLASGCSVGVGRSGVGCWTLLARKRERRRWLQHVGTGARVAAGVSQSVAVQSVSQVEVALVAIFFSLFIFAAGFKTARSFIIRLSELKVSSTLTWSRPSPSLQSGFPVKSKPFKVVIKTSGHSKMAAIVSRSVS